MTELSKSISKIYIVGVAAPVINKEIIHVSKEELERIGLIMNFNKQLKQLSVDNNLHYIDTYTFTKNQNGINTNKNMLDDFHLNPQSLISIIERM